MQEWCGDGERFDLGDRTCKSPSAHTNTPSAVRRRLYVVGCTPSAGRRVLCTVAALYSSFKKGKLYFRSFF